MSVFSQFSRGYGSANRKVVYWLIGINLLFFVLMHLLGFDRLVVLMSMNPIMVTRGWVWTLATYMFVHGGFGHILFNMLGLYIFGTRVEEEWGSREFLIFYLVTGTLAGVFSFVMYFLTGQHNVWLMGASGAVFAVGFAFAVLYPHAIIYIWGILPVRAPIMVLGFTVLEVLNALTGGRGNVAHATHLAGYGFAWLYFVFRLRINPWDRLRMR